MSLTSFFTAGVLASLLLAFTSCTTADADDGSGAVSRAGGEDAKGDSNAAAMPSCTTGAPYPLDTLFPLGPRPETSVPECPMRCGAREHATIVGRHYFTADLPSGACSGALDCTTPAAEGPCCPGEPSDPNATESAGALSVYRCSCVDGAWTCSILPGGGAGICTTVCPDAGAAP